MKMSENPFKVGDIVVAKQGCGESRINSKFDVVAGRTYEVVLVDPWQGVTVEDSHGVRIAGCSASRFQLATAKGLKKPAKFKYGFTNRSYVQSLGYETLEAARDAAVEVTSPGDTFQVIRYEPAGVEQRVLKSYEEAA